MVIDINRLNNANTPATAGRASSAQASSAQSTPSPVNKGQTEPANAKSGEPVQLSREAQQLQNISEKLRDQPISNKERVAQLKQAIADGSYQVDSQRVAKKLFDFESQR